MNATARDRRIRRLRFTCQREEQAQRGRTLLEDALRTASLGDAGRVVVIRSLALGRLSTQASATAWSARLEERMRAAQAGAVFAESAGAASAAAVWFQNEVEVWLALASRAARGVPSSEWFWAAAATGWTPALTSAGTLRVAFHRLAAAGGLPATLALARRLVREGGLPVLLRALASEDVRPVLEAASLDSDSLSESAAEAARPTLSGPWRKIVAEFMADAPAGDARLTWLAVASLSGESMLWPTGRAVQRVLAELRPSAGRTARTPLSGERGETPSAIALPTEADAPSSEETENSAPEPEGVSTACGGLFFLLPLFARLGIADVPDAAAIVWAALRLVLERCSRPRGDELLRLLPHPRSTGILPVTTGILPVSELRRQDACAATAFTLALGVQRLCRQQCGFGLRTLIRRPARVAITETHVDVFFTTAAEVRIRRAALDLDPGWVPWLGRVVSFHYLSRE